MRMYCFVHSALSSIQKGVQCTHAVAELVHVFGDTGIDTPQYKYQVSAWMKSPTLIILEGGFSQQLTELSPMISKTGFLWATFSEDEKTMNNLHTATCVLVPDELPKKATKSQKELMKYIKNSKLAG